MNNRFESKYVTIHGHEVSYRSGGSGSAILFIHGMAGSSRTWVPVMDELASRFRVIAPDVFAHGSLARTEGDPSLAAQANDVRDLMAALGIERATIVGQSLGGSLAMQFAYQHPQACERLVLIASGGLGREVSWILRAITLPGTDYLMPLAFPSFLRGDGAELPWWLRRLGAASPYALELWRAYAALTEASTRKAFVRTLRAVVDPGGQSIAAHDRLGLTAGVPTLIVWGELDAIIPVEHAHAAYRAMPESHLEIFTGAGHFLHVEEPERLATTVAGFVAGTSPSQAEPASYREMLRSRLRASA